MDKVYDQTKTEKNWYSFWEESGFFKPEINPDGAPYSIILPPPNANADLHFGHAMMSIEDILIRFKRMQGYSTLFLPGSDHAGFETQVVFERKLQQEGKSRFDFDRDTLYKMIWDYVQSNKSNMENQLRRLGFSVDWSREKFTLDKDIIKEVYKTFKKMFDDGLIYRAQRLVNYCTKHGTGFSDLEVNYEDRTTPLYFIKYGPLSLATVRPETKFGDTAVAVHPDDERYKKYIGQEIEIETVLGPAKLKVIADKAVDPKFGTGVIKVTPAHSHVDFEIGQRHNLELKQVIGYDGRLNHFAGKFAGMKVLEARKAVVEDMQQKGLIEKVDENYKNRVGVCYKCSTEIEPLPLEQWFINIQNLKKEAVKVVKDGKIKIFPKNFENIYFQWMESLHDWNISRQNIWGIQIPAFFDKNKNVWLVEIDPQKQEQLKNNPNFEQDTDTFDTWFSSGQWPYITLKTAKPGDFEKFYPTSVMETGYDILRAWVSRMIMFGLEVTKNVPFHHVLLHGLVNDPLGKKMSKSKGNVVSPMEIVDQYGADAARMALVYGTATGHDQSLSHPKLQSMRNFTNKLWNIGRYITMSFSSSTGESIKTMDPPIKLENEKAEHEDIKQPQITEDKEILKKLNQTIEKVTQALDQYRFHDATDTLYEFIWHAFADIYIESTKQRRQDAQPILEYVFKTSLQLLHPFMPFITEELWQKLRNENDPASIMISTWPQPNQNMV